MSIPYGTLCGRAPDDMNLQKKVPGPHVPTAAEESTTASPLAPQGSVMESCNAHATTDDPTNGLLMGQLGPRWPPFRRRALGRF